LGCFFETHERGEAAASNAVTPQVSIPKPFKVKLSKLVVETKTTKTTDGACLFCFGRGARIKPIWLWLLLKVALPSQDLNELFLADYLYSNSNG